MSSFYTHVFAVVLVKVIGTGSAGETPAQIADAIANAVAADPGQWMVPIHGSVVTAAGHSFDIDQVEFADEVTWVLVDEECESGDIKQHHFDHTLAPMASGVGSATAKEVELTAKCAQLEAENLALKAALRGEFQASAA